MFKLNDNKTTENEHIALLDFFIAFSMNNDGCQTLFVQKILQKLSKIDIFNNLEELTIYKNTS